MFLDLERERGVSISASAILFSAAHSCPSIMTVELAKKMRIKMKLELEMTMMMEVKKKTRGKMKRYRNMEMKMMRGYPCV